MCLENFIFDDVAGNLCRQREWEAYSFLTGLGDGCRGIRQRTGRIDGLRFGLDKSRQQEIQRRNAFRRIDAAASGCEYQQGGASDHPEHFPL